MRIMWLIACMMVACCNCADTQTLIHQLSTTSDAQQSDGTADHNAYLDNIVAQLGVDEDLLSRVVPVPCIDNREYLKNPDAAMQAIHAVYEQQQDMQQAKRDVENTLNRCTRRAVTFLLLKSLLPDAFWNLVTWNDQFTCELSWENGKLCGYIALLIGMIAYEGLDITTSTSLDLNERELYDAFAQLRSVVGMHQIKSQIEDEEAAHEYDNG